MVKCYPAAHAYLTYATVTRLSQNLKMGQSVSLITYLHATGKINNCLEDLAFFPPVVVLQLSCDWQGDGESSCV